MDDQPMDLAQRCSKPRTGKYPSDTRLATGKVAQKDDQLVSGGGGGRQAVRREIALEAVGFDALDAQSLEEAMDTGHQRFELGSKRGLLFGQPLQPFRCRA